MGLGIFILTLQLANTEIQTLLNLNIAILILGGTLCTSLVAYHGRYVMRTLSALVSIIMPFHISPQSLLDDVAQTIELAKIRTTHSMKEFRMALTTIETEDDFIRYSQNLIATGYSDTQLGDMLQDAIDTHFERQMVQFNILRYMSIMAPVIGLIGTLISTCIFFNNNSAIPMVHVLLPLTYGIMLSTFILNPATEKIRQRYEIIRFRNRLLREGYVLLSAGEDPLAIQDKLNSFLDKTNRFKIANKSLENNAELI